MKVLFIAPHLSTGGMPQYLYKQMEAISSDCEVYCIEWDNVTGGVLVVQRNRIANLLGKKLITLDQDRHHLFKIIKEINPDVIHLQEIPEMFMSYDVALKLYSKDRKYKIIETSHDSSFDINNKRHFPDKFALVSQYQIETYKPLGIPCELVEYPIEYFKRTTTREEILNQLGLDPNKKHVITVGLFTPRKNQAEVIEYARQLQDYPIQFHFLGNQADNFKYYWEPLMKDFPPNCKWWNERSDVDTFYQMADLFLFTSRGSATDKETMPLVIREAISWQVPSLIYNLDVYLNYFDKHKNIEYLDFNNKTKNIDIILNKLNITNNFSKDKQVFFTMNGEEYLQTYEYPNSTWDTLQKYGDAAAQYFATYILKELEPNGFNIKKDSVFVDLGANIGMSSRYASEVGAKEIICFEPDPNLIKIIKKNVPNATVHQYGIGNQRSNVELYHWPFNPVNVGPKYKVDIITLKDILRIVEKEIDYLKIDIEGFERGIFDDLTIEECSKIKSMFLEHHIPDETEKLTSLLKEKGFNVVVHHGMGQDYIYATQKNYMENTNVNDYGIESSWDLSSQTMNYSCKSNINFPIIVSLKEYQSDAVMWATTHDDLPTGYNFWLCPVLKSIHDYEKDKDFTGIKLCIYRKDNNEQIYEKPYFIKFLNKPNVRLSNFVPYNVNYEEFFIKHKFDKWLKNNYDLVIDAGANVGVFSEYMIQQGYASNIVAIECDSIALEDLTRNFKLSDRVKVVPRALSHSNDPIKFYQSKENPVISSVLHPDKLKNHMAGVKGNNEVEVETVTIKDLVSAYNLIDLLKIDIEGAEYEIIKNVDPSLFNNINNILIECHFFEEDYLEKYNALIKKLTDNGYKVEENIENQAITYKGGSETIFATKK